MNIIFCMLCLQDSIAIKIKLGTPSGVFCCNSKNIGKYYTEDVNYNNRPQFVLDVMFSTLVWYCGLGTFEADVYSRLWNPSRLEYCLYSTPSFLVLRHPRLQSLDYVCKMFGYCTYYTIISMPSKFQVLVYRPESHGKHANENHPTKCRTENNWKYSGSTMMSTNSTLY